MSLSELRKRLYRQDPPCTAAPDLFFGPDDEPPAEQIERERQARAICRNCPVNGLCLVLAIAEQPEFGVWAGYNATEIARFFNAPDRAA